MRPDDAAALDAAYREHAGPVLAIVGRVVHAPRATVEDACATAWLRLAGRGDVAPEHVRAWLITTAQREVWDATGRKGWARCEPRAEIPEQRHDDRAAEVVEVVEVLQRLADRSPIGAERVAVALGLAGGYSYAELGEAFGRSWCWIDRALSDTRARARAALAENGAAVGS